VEGKSFPLTDGLSDVSDPVFDKGGKLIWFLASTDAGPVRNWFSLINQDADVTRAIYVATLKAGTPSPLAKESDEEKGADAKGEAKDEKKDDAKADDGKAGKDAKKAEPKKVDPVVIDRDGLASRIVDVPVPPADLSSLSSPNAGEVWFLRGSDGKNALQKWDTKSRKVETIAPEVDGYEVSFDGKKLLTLAKATWAVGPAGKKGEGKPGDGDGKLNLDAVQVRVDPRAEWPQILDEVWRINRDYFYDPGMHGRDWKAIKAKYAPFVAHLSSRADLTRLIQWMCSELAVGHHRTFGGDVLAEPATVPAASSVPTTRSRAAATASGRSSAACNWNPELRAPLSEPGVEVKAGSTSSR
jgi:Uncharacterized protein related to the periplasmic component of the Tol biopolymer transport system